MNAFAIGFGLLCVSCSWFSSADDDNDEKELPPLAIDLVPGEVISTNSQYFETGSADIGAEGRQYLEAVSEEIARSFRSGEYTGPICIEGHTDSRGTTSENVALSQRRADVVKRIMAEGQVQNEVVAVGKGESESYEVDSHLEARRVDILLSTCDGQSGDVPAGLLEAGQIEADSGEEPDTSGP